MGKSKSSKKASTNTAKAQRAPKAPKQAEAPKQTEIPGTERRRVPEIETHATSLRELRTERMEIQKAEGEAQDLLIATMREHGVALYKFDGGDEELVVKVSDKTKVSVRSAKTAHAEDE